MYCMKLTVAQNYIHTINVAYLHQGINANQVPIKVFIRACLPLSIPHG